MIVFNRPYIIGNELEYIKEAVRNGHLSGDGPFTARCSLWLEEHLGCPKVLLTHSCTAALEMAAILCDIKPGDEIIMPSFTFVSTANAFVLRGGVPVFAEIRPDTKNIDENCIEALITERTRVIVPVHYGGVGCDMDKIMALATKYNLLVVEDAAQALCATYHNRHLGSIGDFGCFSFHETKNFISGEGGAIAINRPEFIERAEIIREKGTDRSRFFRGQTDKYTWVDIGSSFLPSELTAAFLYAQLEESDRITAKRLSIWNSYHDALEKLEKVGCLTRPLIPAECCHNAHLYHIMLSSLEERIALTAFMLERDIMPVFHYVPLHSSPAGSRFGRAPNALPITDQTADRLLRLPCYFELEVNDIKKIVAVIMEFFN